MIIGQIVYNCLIFRLCKVNVEYTHLARGVDNFLMNALWQMILRGHGKVSNDFAEMAA